MGHQGWCDPSKQTRRQFLSIRHLKSKGHGDPACGVTVRQPPLNHSTARRKQDSQRAAVLQDGITVAQWTRPGKPCQKLNGGAQRHHAHIRRSARLTDGESLSPALQIKGRAKFLRASQACSLLIWTDLWGTCCDFLCYRWGKLRFTDDK